MKRLIVAATMALSLTTAGGAVAMAHPQANATASAPRHRTPGVSDVVVPALPLLAGASGYTVAMALEAAGDRRRRRRRRRRSGPWRQHRSACRTTS